MIRQFDFSHGNWKIKISYVKLIEMLQVYMSRAHRREIAFKISNVNFVCKYFLLPEINKMLK